MTEPRHKTRHRGIYYRNGSSDPDAKAPRRYVVWYSDSHGKGHTVTLPEGAGEKDALAKQAELRGRQARGEKVVPTKLTVSAALDLWWDERGQTGKRPKTCTSYQEGIARLKTHIGNRRLAALTVDDVAQLIADMQAAGYKAWTIRGTLTPLRGLVTYAQRQGWLSVNPVAQLERSERPKGDQRKMRILTTAEIEKLLAAASSDRWRTLFALLVFTGMRISEALALEWADVDFDGGLVTVRESKTEAGAGRQIVLMPALARLLRLHRLSSGHSLEDDLIFCTEDGGPLDRHHARRALLSALERAGVEHATLHELRHTYASLLIGGGQDVTFVADQLGHADPAITLRVYAKLFDPARRRDEAREKLQAAFGGLL